MLAHGLGQGLAALDALDHAGRHPANARIDHGIAQIGQPFQDRHAGAGQLFEMEAEVDQFAPRHPAAGQVGPVPDLLAVDEVQSMRRRRISRSTRFIASICRERSAPARSWLCRSTRPLRHALREIDHARHFLERGGTVEHAPQAVIRQWAISLGRRGVADFAQPSRGAPPVRRDRRPCAPVP